MGGCASWPGGSRARSCLVWPGCPPRLRLAWPAGGAGLGGLTMSEEGGLEEVDESLVAAASLCCKDWTSWVSAATACSRARTWACSRAQLAQGVGVVVLILPSYDPDAPAARQGPRARRLGLLLQGLSLVTCEPLRVQELAISLRLAAVLVCAGHTLPTPPPGR